MDGKESEALTESIDLALWKRRHTGKECEGGFMWLRLWPG